MLYPGKRSVRVLAALLAAAFLSAGMALAWPPGGNGGGGNGGGGGGEDPPATISSSITLLGTLGGGRSVALGMNNAGDVVGFSSTAPDVNGWSWDHGFLNCEDADGNRVMMDLHDLFEAEGLIPLFNYDEPVIGSWIVNGADDINDDGHIVGTIDVYGPEQDFGFRYTPASVGANGDPVPAQLDDLGVLPGGGNAVPVAINDFGDATGTAIDGNGIGHAFIWTEQGGLIDLGLLNGKDTRGSDINNSGQVVGYSSYTAEGDHAWRFTPGIGYEDLGVLNKNGSGASSSRSINDSGQVAGYSTTKGTLRRAVLYTDGQGMQSLGVLAGGKEVDSYGYSVNNFGDVVGDSDAGSGAIHLFLYTDVTGMIDLEETITDLPPDFSGGLLSYGATINDWTDVCGTATGGTLVAEAFLIRLQP